MKLRHHHSWVIVAHLLPGFVKNRHGESPSIRVEICTSCGKARTR